MTSIVKRNKSFSVVYTSYEGEKKKQRWNNYHSYEATLPKPFSSPTKMLSDKEIMKLLQNIGFSLLGIAVHLAL